MECRDSRLVKLGCALEYLCSRGGTWHYLTWIGSGCQSLDGIGACCDLYLWIVDDIVVDVVIRDDIRH